MTETAKNGILLIDKPTGMRSTDCVNRVRRALGRDENGKRRRVGHAGTLDSTASGLLVLLVGKATKLSDAIMSMPKEYHATFRLGRATDTCDASGQTVFEGDYRNVTDADVSRAMFSFLGWRMQRPPEISAVKLNGRPAHKLARAGQEVNITPRPVFIRHISCSPLEDGRLGVRVRCGRGTYIRSIARDLGTKLGCGAHVEQLRRVSVGPFRVEDAASPESVIENPETARLIAPEEAAEERP